MPQQPRITSNYIRCVVIISCYIYLTINFWQLINKYSNKKDNAMYKTPNNFKKYRNVNLKRRDTENTSINFGEKDGHIVYVQWKQSIF